MEKILAQRLKKLRADKELSQKQIAEIFGIAQPTYASWEIGRTEPDTAMIRRLAIYFDVTADYLLGLSNDVSQSNSVQIGNGSKQSQFNGTFNINQKNKK